jgi:hypothetical protein
MPTEGIIVPLFSLKCGICTAISLARSSRYEVKVRMGHPHRRHEQPLCCGREKRTN